VIPVRTILQAFGLWLVVVAFVSCGGKTVQPPSPPQASYAEQAIRIHLKADEQLNRFQNSAHALHLCIYQLSNPNSMNQYANDASGMTQLLQCSSFDPSVTMAKKLVMQPGSETTLELDRAQGSRYVALCAGYYQLDREHSVRLVKIPVVETTEGWFRKKTTRHLGKLEATFELGPERLKQVGEE
jgi:type VI secretion system VasD/TssJ family lipoprotein